MREYCLLPSPVTRKTDTWDSEEGYFGTKVETLLSFLRYSPDQATHCFIGNCQDLEGLKAAKIVLSFPRHGPDQGTNRLVSTAGLNIAAFYLSFPKHGPGVTSAVSFYLSVVLQFAIALW